MQIIPVSEGAACDDFFNIKNVSRYDRAPRATAVDSRAVLPPPRLRANRARKAPMLHRPAAAALVGAGGI
ncbi:hypothetical protein D3C85_1384260 [compost metagenome]